MTASRKHKPILFIDQAMLLDRAFDRLAEGVIPISADVASHIRSTLLQGIRLRGFFPASSTLLSRFRSFSESDSLSSEELTEALSSDPIMAVRIIAIANSPLFARSVPTETISAAVKQLGLNNIKSIISGIAKTQNYQKVFLGRSVAASALDIVLLTRIIEEQAIGFFSSRAERKEGLAIYGSLLDLSRLLLAFLQPHIYSAIALHCSMREIEFQQSFHDLLGFSMVDMAQEFAKHLGLPKKFTTLAVLAQTPPWLKQRWDRKHEDDRIILSSHIIATRLAAEVCNFRGVAALRRVCQDLARLFVKPSAQLISLLPNLEFSLQERGNLLGYSGCPLPEYLTVFERGRLPSDSLPSRSLTINQRIKSVLYELRSCLEAKPDKQGNGRLSQAIYCTFLGLVRGADFDRAILFTTIAENKSLQPVFIFGQETEGWRSQIRHEDSSTIELMPDIQAMRQRKIVFHGEPVFKDCWPFVAFPLVWRSVVLGVFYADRLEDRQAAPLNSQEEVALMALAELWQQVPDDFF